MINSSKSWVCMLAVSLLIYDSLIAQDHLYINTFGLVDSRNEAQPHYFRSNNWGVVSDLDKSNYFLQVGGAYNLLNRKNITLGIGTSVVVKNKWEDSYLQEAFVNGKLFRLVDFSLGKEAFTPVSYNDTLSTGGFLFNSNARPIPRFTLGFYEYTNVPYTGGFLQIKGGISHGWLNDERKNRNGYQAAEDILLHEKWAYLRLGNYNVKPFVGVFHSSLMGGTREDGEVVEINYFKTFFGEGGSNNSKKVNAWGAHMGFWDFGFNAQIDHTSILFYYQKPVFDGTGFKIWNGRNKDFKIGSLINIDETKLVRKICIELVRTDWQSGPGQTDPWYPKGTDYNGYTEGQIIYDADINEDYNGFMQAVFPDAPTNMDWTKESVWDYIEENTNQGYSFGGRDSYNNNHQYFYGWSYHQKNIGLPLYHSQDVAEAFSTNWEAQGKMFFVNNRVKACHLGVQGQLIDGLDYLLKCTYSINYGSYGEKYQTSSPWELVDGFLYGEGKSQTYTFLSFDYDVFKDNSLHAFASFACDFGELYQVCGGQIGINYRMFKRNTIK